MNFNISEHLPSDFHPQSRVWIYQSDRLFSAMESAEIKSILNEFIASWTAHGAKVKGFSTVLFDTFILIMADETSTHVSGCSTDSSVRVIKELEKKFNTELFDRQLLSFWVDEKIIQIPLSELNNAIKNNLISAETLYFNNTILSKKELEENWIIKLNTSWLGAKLIS
jgi:hypothetical protein